MASLKISPTWNAFSPDEVGDAERLFLFQLTNRKHLTHGLTSLLPFADSKAIFNRHQFHNLH